MNKRIRQPLTKSEEKLLAELLLRMEFPVPKKLFSALVRSVVTVPIELGVFDTDGRVLLLSRNDKEYTGWHVPGTVLRNNENVEIAVQRILSEELYGKELFGVQVAPPQSVGWHEVERGTSPGSNPSRHEISLLFVARVLRGEIRKGMQFFSPDALPEDTLSHHKVLIPIMLYRGVKEKVL